MPSGFKDLDEYTTGFQKGDLIVIGGRPSMEKTAFALNVAQHVGLDMREPVAIFSLEMAKEQLAFRLLCLGPKWTLEAHLPGGNLRNYNAFRDEMFDRYKGFPREILDGVVRRHGSRTPYVLGDIQRAEQLGRHFGDGLTEREIECLIADEWAETAEDILWRRTKCGLHMDAAQRQAVEDYLKSRKPA